MEVGVLALQGAFIEHEHMLERLGVKVREIRQRKDLDGQLDGIIIPGGESTVIGRLLNDLEMTDIIKEKINNGLPVFGTCAGLILLAREVDGKAGSSLATMDIHALRNAYGRQSGSFHVQGTFAEKQAVAMTFIRAPYIENAGPSVKVLATVEGKIVAAREANQLVTAFHPELDNDSYIHEYFIGMVQDHIDLSTKKEAL